MLQCAAVGEKGDELEYISVLGWYMMKRGKKTDMRSSKDLNLGLLNSGSS